MPLLGACCSHPPQPVAPAPTTPAVISIVGTNDLHGQIRYLPILAGYLANLRALRAADGGVLLLDAGDMFQGTLASNLNEGAAVIAIYNALGYAAATIGNHEFDFGPIGPAAVVDKPGQDPRGALKARIAEAEFPFLISNIVAAESGEPIAWANTAPSMIRDIAGVEVGVVGVTTRDVPHTTMPANFAGLAIATPLAASITREARALRARGAMVIVVLAHAGSKCTELADPDDLSSCDLTGEVFRVAEDLPAGLVDVMIGGHSHQTIAHRVNGIAIIESRSGGRAFGRVDVTVDRVHGKVTEVRLHQPRFVCAEAGLDACEPGAYEGRPVIVDASIAALTEAPLARASVRREARLGVVVSNAVERSRSEESALGNLFADLMRAAHPEVDVAVTNGGGLRADLPAGDLTYGALYEAMPFDNRFATVELSAAQLAQLIAANLGAGNGIVSLSGLRATASCAGAELSVELTREDGRPVAADTMLTLLTSDFLASGGDGALAALALPAAAITLDSGPTIRDAMAAELSKRGGELDGADRALFSPGQRRLRYPGQRPVSCP